MSKHARNMVNVDDFLEEQRGRERLRESGKRDYVDRSVRSTNASRYGEAQLHGEADYGLQRLKSARRRRRRERPAHINHWEWQRCRKDMEVFAAMQRELEDTGYRGQWVAIYEGQVLHSDRDKSRLLRELSRTHPGVSVYVQRCGTPSREWQIPTSLNSAPLL